MFIPCDDAKRLIKEKNAQLVDVRTPEEFAMSKLPGAINIPLQDIDRVGESILDKDLPVIVFCRSGQRSHMAMQILMSQNFEEVYNLGSFMAWNQCPDI
ncbi:rhodanese-like domain-containing protein [Thiomicrorhabdus sp. ZW0627]|uniref:rhodanese-like domain-containing protein n=1 Tax=Thiomicrorhabdus sp. ZW0627 TaxID=3039774 RepID=UPI0024369BB0|nr:rhodanese-like domain-containing protein [Thiomicrorhabdus sp. ZW0627]MDG6772793.1 rhodanese-like domain-containing protein [Thiomicrorhabdus sp. ZW0627]